jgi:hypothetical protein
VENNGFELPLGAYYELDKNHKIKFLKSENWSLQVFLNGKGIEEMFIF